MTVLPSEMLINWCKANAPQAPVVLSKIIPLFGDSGEESCSWHPLARALLDEFGGIPDVLRGFSQNMGTFGWSGSVVTYYQRLRQILEQVREHRIPTVRLWVKEYLEYLEQCIKTERTSEEEDEWRHR